MKVSKSRNRKNLQVEIFPALQELRNKLRLHIKYFLLKNVLLDT